MDNEKRRASQKKYKESEKGKLTQKIWWERNKERRKKYNARYYKENLEQINKTKREWNIKNRTKLNTLSVLRMRRLRREALAHYGGKCACCGEKQYEFLVIDHVNGGGNKHRKSIKNKFYDWLKQNDFPKGFQVLCHNCNMAKGFYGICPHKKVE